MLQQCMTRKDLFSQFLLWDHYMASLSHMQKTTDALTLCAPPRTEPTSAERLKSPPDFPECGWCPRCWVCKKRGELNETSDKKNTNMLGLFLIPYFHLLVSHMLSYNCLSLSGAVKWYQLLISRVHLSIYPSILDSLGLTLWYENLPL